MVQIGPRHPDSIFEEEEKFIVSGWIKFECKTLEEAKDKKREFSTLLKISSLPPVRRYVKTWDLGWTPDINFKEEVNA